MESVGSFPDLETESPNLNPEAPVYCGSLDASEKVRVLVHDGKTEPQKTHKLPPPSLPL